MSDVWYKTGQFTTPASGTTVIDVTDKGTNPKFIHVWFSRVTADDTIQAHQGWGHGMSDGIDHDAMTITAQDGANTTDRDGRNANLFLINDPTDPDGADDVLASTVAMNANDVTISYTTFTVGYRIHYEIWGGTDVTVNMLQHNADAATDSPFTHSLGSKPDLIMMMTLGQAHPASSIHSYQSFGIANDNGTSIDQWVQWHFHGDTDTDFVGSSLQSGFSAGQYDVDFADWDLTITAISTTTFTWTNTGSGLTDDIVTAVLNFQGGDPVGIKVGTFQKSTATAPATQAMPDFGFTPAGYAVASCNFDTESKTTDRIAAPSFGAYDGNTQTSALTVGTAQSNTDRASQSRNNEVLQGSVALQASGIQWSGTAQAITDATPDIEWNPNTTGATDDVFIGFYGIELQVAELLEANAGSYAYTGAVVTLKFATPVVAGSYAHTGSVVTLKFTMPVVAGSYAFTGATAGTAKGTVLAANAGAYAFTGATVGTAKGTFLAADAGAYAHTGQTVTLRFTMPVVAGVYTYSGSVVTTSVTILLAANAGSYSLSGANVGTEIAIPLLSGIYSLHGTNINTVVTPAPERLIADAGTYAFFGFDAQLMMFQIDANAGVYAHTGAAVTLRFTMPVNAGVYTYAGQNVTFRFTMPVNAGAYTHTGQNVTFRFTMPVSAGVYTFTGAAVNTVEGFVIAANAGTYAHTGQNVTLRFTMPVVAGVYTFTGAEVVTKTTEVINAEAGTYAHVGAAVTLRFTMPVTAGSYTFVGAAVTTTRAITLVANAGAYTFAGQDIATARGRIVVANAGAYVFTGAAVTLRFTMPVSAGVYVFTGFDAGTAEANTIMVDPGTYVFTGAAVTTTFTPAAPTEIYPYSIMRLRRAA